MATAEILALRDIRTICARLVVLNSVLYTEQINCETVMDRVFKKLVRIQLQAGNR